MENNKGMSTIVVTIIMIVLVLVATGIVWSVISRIIEDSSSEVSLGNKCIITNVVATKMICDEEICNVTLNRKAGGEDIGGIKLIFSNSESGNTGTTVEDVSGNIPELGTKIAGDKSHGLINELPDTVEVAVYFLSESGTEQICSQTKEFKF
jgi:hypothetical protein